MRTHSAEAIMVMAMTIGHLVNANYIVEVAVKNNYSYDDYILLCKCLDRAPVAEARLIAQKQDYLQLSLEGIT